MANTRLPRWGKWCGSAILRACLPLPLAIVLSACGNNSADTALSVPPAPARAGTIVTSSSEPGGLKPYVGQVKSLILSFTPSDGVAVSNFVLSLPGAGLPPGWSMPEAQADARCARVDTAGACEAKLIYAPSAVAPLSILTLPYAYQNGAGKVGAGSVTIAYSALPANSAVATVSPAGPVRGVTGTAASVALTFTTNDGSAASGLHVDSDLSSLPAGWTSASPGLDCPSFSSGNSCKVALTYAPAASTPTATLDLRYHYKDSSGKAQSATASIAYSAAAPNTVTVSASPAGRILVKPGSSQDTVLSFLPSDGVAASAVRITSDMGALPAGWSVKASTLPCAQAGADGACKLTLSYAPDDKQLPGTLSLEYAYANAVGENLTGKASLDYALHGYRAYVADAGDVVDGAQVGGVRQCELDADGFLAGCVKAEGTWPTPGTNNVVVYGARAYVTSLFGVKPIVLCDIAADGALANCADAGRTFDRLNNLVVNASGAYVISQFAVTDENGNKQDIRQISHCDLLPDGKLPGFDSGCQKITAGDFRSLFPTAMTEAGSRVFIAGVNLPTGQNIVLGCLSRSFNNCSDIGLPLAPPIVQSMGTGQARDGAHLYLAMSDLEKRAGSIMKCNLDAESQITGCDAPSVPSGLDKSDLTLVSDIKIAGPNAYLVTGKADLEKKVYRCPLNPDSGDLLRCDSAGHIEGTRNYSMGFR